MSNSAQPASSDRLARVEPVQAYLLGLQDSICKQLEQEDGSAQFHQDLIRHEGGGANRTRVLNGDVIEHAAVNSSHTKMGHLPEAATRRRPELTGGRFEAMSISMIMHPKNPYAPTMHANLRFFVVDVDGQQKAWWFGGGMDLTPYYGFEEDAVHWHRNAMSSCAPASDGTYERFKQQCDEYFFLPHRNEPRGIGGIFFDDFDEGGFDKSFELLQSVGDHIMTGYRPILAKRKNTPYGERERDFQLYRRGRYVEFNLVYDRGTKFGLQMGGRTESILASLPPVAHWRYDYQPQAGTPEAELYETFLKPRDWANS